MSHKCTVLVSTCDKYEDAWPPFFTLFFKMWPDLAFPVYLNTETKDYSFPGKSITCLHPKSLVDKRGNPISWSERLRQALLGIDSKYILLMLEDFFLQKPVRTDVVDDCIAWMDEDEMIGHIDFYHEPYIDVIERNEFSPVDPSYDYALNTLAGLWRREFFLSMLRNENPWDFEFYGTGRWRKTNIKIYTHRKEFPRVFNYGLDPELGYGIFRGKWLQNNKDLFEMHGIVVNYERLGIWDKLPELRAREREKHWFIHDIQKALKDPKAMAHYLRCTYDVVKDKLAHIRQKFFNP